MGAYVGLGIPSDTISLFPKTSDGKGMIQSSCREAPERAMACQKFFNLKFSETSRAYAGFFLLPPVCLLGVYLAHSMQILVEATKNCILVQIVTPGGYWLHSYARRNDQKRSKNTTVLVTRADSCVRS